MINQTQSTNTVTTIQPLREKTVSILFAIMTFCAVLPLYFEDTRQVCGLVFIGLMGYLFTSKRKPLDYQINEVEWKWMAVSVIYASVFIMSYLMRESYTDDGSWRIAAPGFILLLTAWYFLLLRFNAQKNLIVYVSLSSILAGILLFILEVSSLDSFDGYRYGAIYSDLGAAGFNVAITSVLLAMLWFQKRRQIFMILIVFGVVLVGLNGSRTAVLIVLFPIALIGLQYVRNFRGLTRSLKLQLLVGFLTVFTVLGFFAQDKIFQTFSDISLITESQYNTSLGQRLVMLDVGSDVALNNFVLGVGPSEYKNSITEAFKNYDYDSSLKMTIIKYTQIHNQYLMDIILSGLFGLISLLMFVFFPMLYFIRSFNASPNQTALIGFGFLIGIAFIMLFGAIFTYTYTTIIYFLAVSAMISSYEKSEFVLNEKK